MQKDIQIIKGEIFSLLVNLQQKDEDGNIQPFDATGFGLRGQIRRSFKGVTKWDFTFNIINFTLGELELIMGADVTETLPVGTLVYDVEIFDPNNPVIVHKISFGNVNVMDEVTKEP